MIKIHYLPPDAEMVTHWSEVKEWKEEFLNHPQSTWYTLKDFQEAFNCECISDQGYILITDD